MCELYKRCCVLVLCVYNSLSVSFSFPALLQMHISVQCAYSHTQCAVHLQMLWFMHKHTSQQVTTKHSPSGQSRFGTHNHSKAASRCVSRKKRGKKEYLAGCLSLSLFAMHAHA